VAVLSGVGSGFPDLLVCFNGRLALMEVKDGMQPPSKQRLTRDELDWHSSWTGPVFIVNSITEAIRVIDKL
jgi:hypothetical protein